MTDPELRVDNSDHPSYREALDSNREFTGSIIVYDCHNMTRSSVSICKRKMATTTRTSDMVPDDTRIDSSVLEETTGRLYYKGKPECGSGRL